MKRKKKIKTQSIDRQLEHYSTAAEGLLAVTKNRKKTGKQMLAYTTATAATVVATVGVLGMDSVANAAMHTIYGPIVAGAVNTASAARFLDLNGDGNTDFTFRVRKFAANRYRAWLVPRNSNAIVAAPFAPAVGGMNQQVVPLPSGYYIQSILPTNAWVGSSQNVLVYDRNGTAIAGLFPSSAPDLFAGMRLIYNTSLGAPTTKYGWIEIHFGVTTPPPPGTTNTNLTITMYAYSDIPDGPVIAGGGEPGGPAVPEPATMVLGSLSFLAAGAVGIRERRRRKMEEAEAASQTDLQSE